MSDKKKKAPKRKPAHQNSYAFKHNKHSKLTAAIEKIPNVMACQYCTEQIAWKKKYRKYKPLKGVRKCNTCGEMTIRVAYHTQCFGCSKRTSTCGKCLKPLDNTGGERKLTRKIVDDVLAITFPKLGHQKTIERKLAAKTLTKKELLRMCSIRVDQLPEKLQAFFEEPEDADAEMGDGNDVEEVEMADVGEEEVKSHKKPRPNNDPRQTRDVAEPSLNQFSAPFART